MYIILNYGEGKKRKKKEAGHIQKALYFYTARRHCANSDGPLCREKHGRHDRGRRDIT